MPALSFELVIEMTVIGLCAGVFGGLLGVGGGLIMIPAMLLVLGEQFGENSLHVYKLAALGTAAVLSVPAARQHARAGATVYPIFRAMVLGAVVGVVAGALLAGLFVHERTHVLRRIFGLFMLLVVGFEAFRRGVAKKGAGEHFLRTCCPTARRWPTFAGLVGFPSGALAGLLGIGGGIWAVPMQHYGLGVRLRNAIANSGTTIVFAAAAAALVQSVFVAGLSDARAGVDQGWLLALFLAPGALLGGWLGGSLTHRMPIGWLRLVFHILLAVAGLRLLLAD